MKIVAICDLHGNLAPVQKILELETPELLLCAGDWGVEGEIDAADFEAITDRVFTLTVFGNHDHLDLLPNVLNQDGSPILIENGVARSHEGVRLGGINGIWAKSKKKPWYIADDEVAEAAEKLDEDEIDILITHGCPIGLADLTPTGRHGGQRCFLKAFQVIQPRLYLCGHLHRKSFHQTKNGELIVNVGFTKEGDYAVFKQSGGRFEFESKRI